MARALKYQPLSDHLRRNGEQSIKMTFEQIGELVGGLPMSAMKFPQWWENTGHHSQSRAWLEAGYRVEGVDRERKRASFKRK